MTELTQHCPNTTPCTPHGNPPQQRTTMHTPDTLADPTEIAEVHTTADRLIYLITAQATDYTTTADLTIPHDRDTLRDYLADITTELDRLDYYGQDLIEQAHLTRPALHVV